MPSKAHTDEDPLKDLSDTVKRKMDHLEICLIKDVQAKRISTGFEDIRLIHRALPEVALDDVSLSASFLGHDLEAPILIDSMTGGFPLAQKINSSLAQVAEELGIGIGVGSQRVALNSRKPEESFRIVRKMAPSAFIVANIGCPQIRGRDGVDVAQKSIDMIDADALAVHLNPLQEALQPEGETDFRGCLESIRGVAEEISTPLMVKETGAGISGVVAKALAEVGVEAINVAGAGGTSWAAVEYYRNLDSRNEFHADLGETLWDWGIPTAFCVYDVSKSVPDLPLVASGGIRSGLDAAKSIVLGADLAGIALPLLSPACDDAEAAKERMNRIIAELRTAMFLTGSKDLVELKEARYLVSGRLLEWIQADRMGTEI